MAAVGLGFLPGSGPGRSTGLNGASSLSLLALTHNLTQAACHTDPTNARDLDGEYGVTASELEAYIATDANHVLSGQLVTALTAKSEWTRAEDNFRDQPLFVIVGDQSGWQKYISSQFFYLFKALQRLYNWRVLPRGHWTSWRDVERDAFARFGAAPTVVLFAEDFETPTALANSSLPAFEIWMFMNDLHDRGEGMHEKQVSALRACTAVVAAYVHVMDQHLPEVRSMRRIPLPHSASPLFQVPLNPSPISAVLLGGSTTRKWYPYRALVHDKILSGDPRFVLHPHPGYDRAYNPKNDTGVGAGFARLLNAHLATITDGLHLNYTVAKVRRRTACGQRPFGVKPLASTRGTMQIFEIPATGSLLLLNSEMLHIVAALGFQPYEHYIPYTAATLDHIVDTVLDPRYRGAIDRIRKQGQLLVWARHATVHRAAALHEVALDTYYQQRRSVAIR